MARRPLRWQKPHFSGLALLFSLPVAHPHADPAPADGDFFPDRHAYSLSCRRSPRPWRLRCAGQGFLGEYGVIAVLVSGTIGGILTLIFDKLLGPIIEEWGRGLKERLKIGALS